MSVPAVVYEPTCARVLCAGRVAWRLEYVLPCWDPREPAVRGVAFACRAHVDGIRTAVTPYAVTPASEPTGCERATAEPADAPAHPAVGPRSTPRG
jgi:hypothetical protein